MLFYQKEYGQWNENTERNQGMPSIKNRVKRLIFTGRNTTWTEPEGKVSAEIKICSISSYSGEFRNEISRSSITDSGTLDGNRSIPRRHDKTLQDKVPFFQPGSSRTEPLTPGRKGCRKAEPFNNKPPCSHEP